MISFDESQIEVIRDLRVAYPSATIAMIGAGALSLHIPMSWRNTADLDFVLTIPVDDLNEALGTLTGWKKTTHQEHRWQAPNGLRVDIVPAPREALDALKVVFPRTRNEMSLIGVRLALEEPQVEVGEGIAIAIASVPVIALLKMAAYLDQPYEREKDLQDIANILAEYPSVSDDRLFGDEIFDRGLEERQARGFILGSEIGRLANEIECAVVDRFLGEVCEGDTSTRFVRNSPWPFDEDQLRLRIEGFELGFSSHRRHGTAEG